jgi:hypothetical protein
MDFLKWYKNIIDSADQEPPASVWEGVQEELDIDAVWSGINKELQESSKKRVINHMSAAASILLIIAAGTFFFLNSGNKEMPEPASLQAAISVPEKPESGESVDVQPVVVLTGSRGLTAGKGVSAEAKMSDDHPGRGVNLTKLPGLACRYITAGMGFRGQETGDSNEDHTAGKGSLGLTGFYAGLSGHVGNTWLLNNKTIEGLRNDALTAALPSFGYSFGILAGKRINDRLDIQAEAIFISRTNQNYNEYLHGKYIYNNYQFNYSSIIVSGRWYINHKAQKRHSVTLGAYAGLLRNAIQDLDGETLSLKHDYNRADYGVITGYEFIHRIDSHISLGTGFQARAGLNNIFVLSLKYDLN